MPFTAFIVLHQLLLAYPANIFFQVVATITCLHQDSDQRPVPNQRDILRQELMFLKELEGRQKQILAKLKTINELQGEFEESLTGFQLPEDFETPIRDIKVQTVNLRFYLEKLSEKLVFKKSSLGLEN
jgi:hypothetical protein